MLANVLLSENGIGIIQVVSHSLILGIYVHFQKNEQIKMSQPKNKQIFHQLGFLVFKVSDTVFFASSFLEGK